MIKNGHSHSRISERAVTRMSVGHNGVAHLALTHPSGPAYEVEVFRRNWLMDLAKQGSCHLDTPHRLNFHLLMLCLKGRGEHQIDFVRWTCLPGTVVHVWPGQIHRWNARDEIEAVCVVFSEAFLHTKVPVTESRPPAVQLLEAEAAPFRKLFDVIESTWTKENDLSCSVPILQHLVLALLGMIARAGTHPPTGAVEERARGLIARFTNLLEARHAQARDVGSYARSVGVSARTLNRACTLMYRRTAKEMVDARVVLEAKRMLAHTALSVAEIASQLGFSEATNFVKFFRRQTNVSPGMFRSAHLWASQQGVVRTQPSSVVRR